MNEIRPQTQTLQVVSRKIRKPFTMVFDCIDNHPLSTGAKNTYRRLTSLIRLCGGVCDWTERRIVAHLGMRLTTYQYHRRALEAAGLIEVIRRKKPGCRFNDANLLRLKGGASEIRYLKTTELNTNTTTPREVSRVGPAPSYARIKWEHNRFQNHPPAMRELYDRNGALIAENRMLRQRYHSTKEDPAETARLRDEESNKHYENMLEVLRKWGERV